MKKFLLFLFIFFLSVSLCAEDILKGNWDRTSYKLGDEAVLTIVLPNLPENFFVEGIPSPKADSSDFRILGVEKKRESNGSANLQLKMMIFAAGKTSFPVDKIKILTEKGETSYKLEIPPIEIGARVSSSDSPPAIASPIEIPKSFPILETTILALALLALAVFFILRFLKKRKPQSVEEKKFVHKTIEEYLIHKIDEKLKKSVLSLQDYSELTEDIRMYLEEKCQIDALFMTTSELLETLKENFPFKVLSIYEATDIFVLSDLVKFAKHFPNDEEEKRFRGNLLILQKDLKERLLGKEKAA